jgi:hypothetical protein
MFMMGMKRFGVIVVKKFMTNTKKGVVIHLKNEKDTSMFPVAP